MIKYVPQLTSVVIEEIPDMLTLAVEISNCRGNCVGCHSAFLKKDIGDELTPEIVNALIKDNYGVNCFLLLGEGNDKKALLDLVKRIKEDNPTLKLAIYSGRPEVEDEIWQAFDYVKVGEYRPEYGPLNKKTTNQRLYKIVNGRREDITYRFWHRGVSDSLKNSCS